MMKRYDKAFKEEAVRLSDEIGSKKAAEQLGLAYHTLQGWRKQRTLHGDVAHIGSRRTYASADKTVREIELERDIGELRRVNEILKDALGFIAKDRKRRRHVSTTHTSVNDGNDGPSRRCAKYLLSANRAITVA